MDRLLEPFLSAPHQAGVFLDFDGTLSEVVPVPSEARPVAGARQVLAELGKSYGVVAVVSGRSAGELVSWLGPDVEIWGTHGAERAVGGEIELSERAAEWTGAVGAALGEARERVESWGLHGAVVEDKTVVLGLHWRNATDREHAENRLRALAEELSRAHSLVVAESKMAVELRPPVEFSKADAVLATARARHLRAALFAGDDVVDLPAFDALDELARDGVATVRVAVDSEETPAEVARRADLSVDGPGGMIALLRHLATATRRPL